MSWTSTLTGRRIVVLCLLLLPFVCFVPWILVTGPFDIGHKYGILAEFKLQTLVDPKTFDSSANQAAEAVGQIDLLRTREAANRLNSLAATALLVFVTVGAGVYGWMVAWRLAAKLGDRGLFVPAGVIAVILLVLVWPNSYHRIYDLLGKDVFQSTIGTIYGGMPLAVLDHQQIVNNFVLVIAGVGLAFAAALIAVLATRLGYASDLATYVELKRYLDRILIGSALMLAAGVIDLKQWTALPVPFMGDPDLAAAYNSFVGGFVSLQSICYVAGLVMMFLPAAWLLNNARERMIHNVQVEQAAAEVPPGGFAVTDLLRVAAMLAPILVGPVANFVNLRSAF